MAVKHSNTDGGKEKMKHTELLGAYIGKNEETVYSILAFRSKAGEFTGVVLDDDDYLIEDILTLAYDTPDKVKKLLDMGGIIKLNTRIPDEKYINRTKRALTEGYLVAENIGYIRVATNTKDGLKAKFDADLMTLSAELYEQLTGTNIPYKTTMSLLAIRTQRANNIYLYDEGDGLWYKSIMNRTEQYSFISGFEALEKSEMTLEKCEDCRWDWLEDYLNDSWVCMEWIREWIQDYKEADEDIPEGMMEELKYFENYQAHKEEYSNKSKLPAPEEITPELICKTANSEFKQKQLPYRIKYGRKDGAVTFVLYNGNEEVRVSMIPIYFFYDDLLRGLHMSIGKVLAEIYSRYRYGNYEGSL